MNLDFLPIPTKSRKVKQLQVESKKISENQTNLSRAYQNLTTASMKITNSIKELEGKDFSDHKKAIAAMNLEPKYKENLVNEITASRDQAVQTLKPLRETAEKLRGNMIVTQEKSLQYLAVIAAQSEVYKAGLLQVETLKKLQATGQELGNRIDSLLGECERINRVTRDALAPFKGDILTNDRSKSFLAPSPKWEGEEIL